MAIYLHVLMEHANNINPVIEDQIDNEMVSVMVDSNRWVELKSLSAN